MTGDLFWRMATPLARTLFRWYFQMERRGPPAPSGPLVVAANHFSHLDPIVVGIMVGRPTRYLAVDELYGNSRVFDGFTQWVGAIPMTRTRVPLGPLRLALAELAAGNSIGLFPEGIRVWTWGEREPKRGAAWLAHRSGVPLLPIAIAGTDEAMGRGTARISRRPIVAVNCDLIDPRDHSGEDDPVGSITAEWRRRIDGAIESVYTG